jgi:HSP20 family molecular chaperone IbpA
VQLPEELDPNGVAAVLKDGVLNIRLKKSPESRARKIPVRQP